MRTSFLSCIILGCLVIALQAGAQSSYDERRGSRTSLRTATRSPYAFMDTEQFPQDWNSSDHPVFSQRHASTASPSAMSNSTTPRTFRPRTQNFGSGQTVSQIGPSRYRTVGSPLRPPVLRASTNRQYAFMDTVGFPVNYVRGTLRPSEPGQYPYRINAAPVRRAPAVRNGAYPYTSASSSRVARPRARANSAVPRGYVQVD